MKALTKLIHYGAFFVVVVFAVLLTALSVTALAASIYWLFTDELGHVFLFFAAVCAVFFLVFHSMEFIRVHGAPWKPKNFE